MILLILVSAAGAGNRYPIVLIHGFIGWGQDELKNYHYWGGDINLAETLRSQGFDVLVVSVGPISSNWDRAAEIYYQLKGGQVDYGKAHSREFGLIQKPEGKNYPGLYPEWDAAHPVHLIGHSMGGQTARMLEVMLKSKFAGEDSDLLGQAHQGWVKSVTTIATPHNGTTLVPLLKDILPFALEYGPILMGLYQSGSLTKYYDFDLDQYGLVRLENEDFKEYIHRLQRSPFGKSKNYCGWDLSPDGAVQLNQMYETDPKTYYFSYATYSTRRETSSPKHIPDEEMTWRVWLNGYKMGRYEPADSTWYKNDGVVNSISMIAPSKGPGETEPWQTYTGIPVPGVWQFMQYIHMCHMTVVGHSKFKGDEADLIALYQNHCRILYSLSPDTQ